MKSFKELFQEHANRIKALTQLGLIVLEGLSQTNGNPKSKFSPMFDSMAKHIPEHHQNHPVIDMHGYKVVAFVDGLTFIAMISEIEAFLQSIIVTVLLKHPEKIGKSSLELKSILSLTSIEDIKVFAAEKFASEIFFRKPNDYKKELISILNIDESALAPFWPIFVEAKARRDIGVHNAWIVNDIYRAKLREVSLPAPTDNSLSVDSQYLISVRASCINFMEILHLHCTKTFQN